MAPQSLSISFSNLHHAYLISGDKKTVPQLLELLESGGASIHSSHDIRVEYFETFGVEDSRRVKEWQGEHSVSGGKRFFVFYMMTPTREAGQALLKVLEEPKSDVHFFIITPRPFVFPPTVFSRVVFLNTGSTLDIEMQVRARDFLNADEVARLASIKKMIARHDKDETSEPLKDEALSFLNHIEEVLANHVRKDSSILQNPEFLEQFYACKNYMFDKGASTKMLLEHVALVIPV